MNLKQWYKGLRIPNFTDRRAMDQFATSMISSFSITSGDALNIRPKFFLSDDIPTAAIDLQETRVYIGRNIFSHDPAKRYNPEATEIEALTTVFGMVFHESMHFVHTTHNLEAIAAGLVIEQQELYLAVNNVLEDYYIDNIFLNTMPQYTWTYEERFAYFFSTEKGQENLDTFLSQPTAANLLNLMTSMKNPANRSLARRLAPEHRSIVEAGLAIMDNHDREQRPLDAYEVYKMLLEDTETSTQQEVKEASEGDGEVQLNGEEALGEAKEVTDEITMCRAAADGTYRGGLVEIVPHEQDGIAPSGAFFAPLRREAADFTIDERYLGFAKLLKATSETSTFWTPPTNKGRNIRSISRIATDGKIFSTKVVEQGLGPQEVLLLVDCSGSMCGNDNIWKAIQAASAVAASLESGRHAVAVYGHTADHDNVKAASTVLYRFKGFAEKFDAVKQRFIQMYCSAGSYTANNDDELAILEVSKRFTKARNAKTLIVISDGEPACERHATVESTHEAVVKVRSMGISVISISIDKSAVRANNEIYGADHNFDNENPNVVTEVIRKFAKF